MNNNISIKNADVKTVLIHSLVFSLPFLTLISKQGTGICSFGFLLAAIWCWKQGWPQFRLHWQDLRGVLAAFVLTFAFSGLVVLLHDGIYLRAWEKPSRMLFAASAVIAVLAVRPNRKALWWGLVAGAVAGASLAVYQRWYLGVERPGGGINAITFGDIVLCMGLMSLAGVMDFPRRQRIWPALGAVAGIIGTLATGTRGSWVAIVLAALLFFKYGHYLRGKFARGAALVVALLMVGAYFVPQTGVQERLVQGVRDVQKYYAGEDAFSNVGVRLELWKGAAMLAQQHPFTPASASQVKVELRELVAQGRLQPFVLQFEHFHNDAMQALVYGGVAGLLLWFATLLLPFRFFLRMLDGGGTATPPALAGLLLVLCYFSFGLTEVIFWSVRASMFYALMLFVLAGLCLAARQTEREKQ